MNLFDRLIHEALEKKPELITLQNVVEKEVLHHEILRALKKNGLLEDLTFIGGTCLRTCYKSIRLSEDLDFTGGKDFTKDKLSKMGLVLQENLAEKYGLRVNVTEPKQTITNVATWKIKVETRPESKNLPAQRINIDICSVPSYDTKSMILINHYAMDLGTAGLTIQAQSREEILLDKVIAFALRKNRLKHRDLWDIFWLNQNNIELQFNHLVSKLNDHRCAIRDFYDRLLERLEMLSSNITMQQDFRKEMRRFLPPDHVQNAIESKEMWTMLVHLMQDIGKKVQAHLKL